MDKLWVFIGFLLLALLAIMLGPILYREEFRAEAFTMIVREGRIQNINLSDMSNLQEGPFIVYFTPECEGLAAKIIRPLMDIWEVIPQRLGINLEPIGMAVIPLAEDQGGVQIAGKVVPLLLDRPCSQEVEHSVLSSFYRTVLHEATELAIAPKLYHDPRTRWVGDGLAEYAAYIMDSQLSNHQLVEIRAKELRRLQDQGRQSYNLIKQFLVRSGHKIGMNLEEIAGYGISLAFWLQITQKHGEDVIKTFWERVSTMSRPSAKDAARILSELTGEDIWAKLQNMDLQEVLKTLEEAAGAPTGP